MDIKEAKAGMIVMSNKHYESDSGHIIGEIVKIVREGPYRWINVKLLENHNSRISKFKKNNCIDWSPELLDIFEDRRI